MQKAWQCLRSQLGLVLPASGPRQWAATPATLPGLTTLRPFQIQWAARVDPICGLRGNSDVISLFNREKVRPGEMPVFADFSYHLVARM